MNETPAPVLDAIGIVAADLAASTEFYRRLGIDVPTFDGPHAEAELSGGMRLMWDSAELAAKLDPERTPPSGGARAAFAFRCASPEAVDELYSDMDAAGFGHTPPYNAPWGQRYASLRDSDGNPVDLYCSQ